jgi:hypothetical protein
MKSTEVLFYCPYKLDKEGLKLLESWTIISTLYVLYVEGTGFGLFYDTTPSCSLEI